MAKKATKDTVETLHATSPQSTQAETVSLPCALKYFFTYARLAWGYCRAQLPKFFAESDRFTVAFIDEQELLVLDVENLPKVESRTALASAAREVLLAAYQDVNSMAKRLRTAIDYAFKEAAVAEIERKEAGIAKYSASPENNWGSAADFIVSANLYLGAKAAQLVAAGAIKATFPDAFSAAGKAFNEAWVDFMAKEKAATTGTKALHDGLKLVLLELNPMLATGKEIFEFDATTRKQFTTTDLLNEVRGHHPGGASGFVRKAATGKPIVGARVAVSNDPEKFAITDGRGKFELRLPTGIYDLRFTAEGELPLTILKRKVQPGVMGRLNVELAPVPVEVAIVAETPAAAPAPSAVPNSQLNSALSEMMAEAKATNGAMTV